MGILDFMEREDRPLGVALLSVLHFISGILIGVLAIWGLTMLREPRVAEGIAKFGIPIPLLATAIGFLVLLGVLSGVGMWKGTRWGWYLGSFYYVYSFVRNLNAFFAVDDLFAMFGEEGPPPVGRGPEYYYLKFSLRAFFCLLLYFYFFKGNVREYFGFGQMKMWPLIVSQVALCIAIMLTGTAWYMFSE